MAVLNKYIWLLEVIQQGGERGVLFEDIAQKWSIKFEETLSKRTFHHQRNSIEDIFDLNIICDRRTNRYSIESVEDMKSDELRCWILDNFSLRNYLIESQSIRNRILIEHQPSSELFLMPLIEAMETNNIVTMEYHSFKQEHPITISLAPYFVKQKSNRWYLYGVEVDKNDLKLYALDRIKKMNATDDKFELPSNFSAHAKLNTAFGVALYDNITPTTITIRTYGDKSKYLDTLYLHHSQRRIDSNTYELYVAPTEEFYRAILKQGDDIEIIAPAEVRKEFKSRLNKIRKLY